MPMPMPRTGANKTARAITTVRLNPKRRFAKNHFQHTEKEVRPKRRFGQKKQHFSNSSLVTNVSQKARTATLNTPADSPRRELSAGVSNVAVRALWDTFATKILLVFHDFLKIFQKFDFFKTFKSFS